MERADSLLWDRVILGIEDKSLRERQLRETDASLEVEILKDFRAIELGRKQASRKTNKHLYSSNSKTRSLI